MTLAAPYLHGFGARYDLPASLSLYLYAAGAVVVVSFVLVVYFARGRAGQEALAYPRRASRTLVRLGNSAAIRFLLAFLGVIALAVVLVAGFAGSQDSVRNPAEYVVWIYFWAGLVILTGLIGNIWSFLNPFQTLYRLVRHVAPPGGSRHLPERLGIWPAAALYFGFAWLELASGQAAHPAAVAALAAAYTVATVTGMLVYGEKAWLDHCEVFTVLFGIIGRFGPVEAERDDIGRLTQVWLRPWGAGLLARVQAGWDRIVFVILTLASLAFDGVISTTFWGDLTSSSGPFGQTFGSWPDPVQHTIGLTCISLIFLTVFAIFMRLVLLFGGNHHGALGTKTAFAFTLVPIALVYNAAHNYTYVVVQSQAIVPLLADPLAKGWNLVPTQAFRPNFLLAQAETVWYAQIVLIVLGHVIAVYLAHLRAAERFATARAVILSQYPMLVLMVGYTMTSLWILAQPITKGG